MQSLMKQLLPAQQLWFARLCIGAIQADGVVRLSEFEYFSRLASLLSATQEREELVKQVESGEPLSVEIKPPAGLAREMLPQIFVELGRICLVDDNLSATETTYLRKISQAFGFSPIYEAQLMDWCLEGLNWRQDRLDLCGLTPHRGRVPVHQLSQSQRIWYAELLISALNQGHPTRMEMSFLQGALGFLEDPAQRARLSRMIDQGERPELGEVPQIKPEFIRLALAEALALLGLSEGGQTAGYLARLVQVTGLPKERVEEISDWLDQGLQWTATGRDLAQCGEFV